MTKVTAVIAREKYRTVLASSTNEIVAGKPLDLGGTDVSFSPAELMSASLASCTAIKPKRIARLIV